MGAWDMPRLALLMTVLNFAYSHWIHARLEQAAAALENASAGFAVVGRVLALIEQEPVSSPDCSPFGQPCSIDGTAPSAAIAKLARIVDLLESRHSLFARPLDLVTFWSAQLVFVAERWQQEFGPHIRAWLEAAGEFEALTSLSAFAYEHPRYVVSRVCMPADR